MKASVAVGVLFGPLVLVVSSLFSAATGPGVPPWADAAGAAIRLYGTALAVVVGPLAVHLDRASLARRGEWTPARIYYLVGLPVLSVPISLAYLSRRLTAV